MWFPWSDNCTVRPKSLSNLHGHVVCTNRRSECIGLFDPVLAGRRWAVGSRRCSGASQFPTQLPQFVLTSGTLIIGFQPRVRETDSSEERIEPRNYEKRRPIASTAWTKDPVSDWSCITHEENCDVQNFRALLSIALKRPRSTQSAHFQSFNSVTKFEIN